MWPSLMCFWVRCCKLAAIHCRRSSAGSRCFNANPDNPAAYLLRAKAMAAAGEDAAEVEKLLRKSIALKNDGWQSHYELGVLLEANGISLARPRNSEQSAKLNPDVAAIHYHLARVYHRMQRPQDAARERAKHQELTAREKVTAGMEPVR